MTATHLVVQEALEAEAVVGVGVVTVEDLPHLQRRDFEAGAVDTFLVVTHAVRVHAALRRHLREYRRKRFLGLGHELAVLPVRAVLQQRHFAQLGYAEERCQRLVHALQQRVVLVPRVHAAGMRAQAVRGEACLDLGQGLVRDGKVRQGRDEPRGKHAHADAGNGGEVTHEDEEFVRGADAVGRHEHAFVQVADQQRHQRLRRRHTHVPVFRGGGRHLYT